MTPAQIEEMRRSGVSPDLCELALDGLRFRAWIAGARSGSGTVALLARTLAPCVTADDYRRAIDEFIVASLRGRA